jgi:putative aldouronate transport system substrate-binding protein
MQDGMCVPASSRNPERALMFLELLRTDQRYYNYFTYGLEGVHYEITPDNYLKQLDPDGFAAEGYCSWGFKSLDYYVPPLGAPPNWDETVAELKSLGRDNPFVLFTPNFDPVKNEWAAIINVIQQYRLPLTYGYMEDPEAGLVTLVEKLKEAGADKVLAEMQSQLDAYLGK